MSARRHTLAVGLLAALIHNAGWAQGEAARTLLEQGRYWQAQDKSDQAAQAWEKLLLVEPGNAEALYGMAVIELKAQRAASAQGYLARLKAAAPDSKFVPLLEQDIRLAANPAKQQYEQASKMAQAASVQMMEEGHDAEDKAGQRELGEAIAMYDRALGNKPPQGDVAREYYNYLGYTEGGLAPAIQGLERLLAEKPDPMTELMLSQHLIRQDSRRMEGLRRLERLSKRADMGGAAGEVWRQTLAWMAPPSSAAERASYQAYLQAHPDDDELRQLMNKPRPAGAGGPPQDPRLTRGFRALKAEDLAAAEREFSDRLATHPNDPDALGGLGLVRMQQNDLVQAEALLARAVSRPGASPNWNRALNSARYWTLVNQAVASLDSRDLPSARRQLDQALKLNAREPAGRNALGRLYVEQNDLAAAEKTFRAVLASDRNNRDAMSGLVNVLAQSGRPEQAMELISKLTPAQREELGDLGRLRAAVAAGRAKAAEQRGDLAGARRALEDAMREDPDNAWIRLDLARHYLAINARSEARGIVDGLLLSNPDMPEALYASALLSARLGEWEKAQATLARIPESERTQEMAATEQQVWIHVQAEQASQLAKRGGTQEARDLLARLEPAAGRNPDLLGAIAQAYVDAGDPARGLALLRPLMSGAGADRADVLLPYAGVLLKTGQDVEAAGALRKLQAQNLTTDQRLQLDDLVFLYTVRQADLLRERNDLVAAYDTLAPALAKRPNDVLALGALARMYADGGDHEKALALYRKLIEQDPDNADLHIGAAMMATQMDDTRYARTAVDRALAIAPDDPNILASAARIYRMQGRSGKAAELLAAAIAAEEKRSQPTLQAAPARAVQPESSPLASANPFVGLPGQRTRSTLPPQVLAEALPAEAAPAQGASGAPAPMALLQMPRQPAGAYAAPAPSSAPAATLAPASAGAATAQPVTLPEPAALRPAAQARAPLPPPPPAPRGGLPADDSLTPYPATTASIPAPASEQAGLMPSRLPATAAASPSTRDLLTVQPAGRSATAQPIAIPQSAAALPPPPSPAPSYAAPQAAAPAQPQLLADAGTPAPVISPRLGDQLRDELREIQEERTPEVRAGAFVRSNDGASGTSKLTTVETPVEVRLPVGDGKLALQVTPVQLDAGRVGGENYRSGQFGGGPQAALDQEAGLVGSPGSQKDSGVGLAVAYEMQGLRADIGTTPLGFRKSNVVGGVEFDGTIGGDSGGWYTVGASRRAVTDSLLSFAGARDDRSGDTWGAVTTNGVHGQIGKDMARYGFYGYGSWDYLDGHGTESNTRAEAGVGVYWHLLRETNRVFTAGLNLGGVFYDNNQRFFTYGHGGYFSPQEFYSLSVPLTWAQRNGRFSYKLQGAVGIQHFRESDADYFPTSGGRQRNAVGAAEALGLTDNAVYDGQSDTGVGYNLSAAAEYQLAGNWFLGGAVSLDNASDYKQWAGGLYLRYTFYPQRGPMEMPLRPYQSPYRK